MKPAKITLCLQWLLALFALGMTVTVQADEGAHKNRHNDVSALSETRPAVTVSYDKAADHLSVVAEAASLKYVLGRVAQLSGIEVLFDDQADGPLTIDIKSDSLEQGLNTILKGSNFAMRYSRDDKARLLLVGVMVLPAGEHNTGRAKPLMAMEGEAYYRAKNQLSHEQIQKMDIAAERWQARMSEMPPERRAAMEKRINDRLLKEAIRDQKIAENRERRKQQAAELKAQRKADREAMLQMLPPEERAGFEQRGIAAREEVKKALLEGQY